MKTNIFQGDITDTSAWTKPLIATYVSTKTKTCPVVNTTSHIGKTPDFNTIQYFNSIPGTAFKKITHRVSNSWLLEKIKFLRSWIITSNTVRTFETINSTTSVNVSNQSMVVWFNSSSTNTVGCHTIRRKIRLFAKVYVMSTVVTKLHMTACHQLICVFFSVLKNRVCFIKVKDCYFTAIADVLPILNN